MPTIECVSVDDSIYDVSLSCGPRDCSPLWCAPADI